MCEMKVEEREEKVGNGLDIDRKPTHLLLPLLCTKKERRLKLQ